MIILASKSPIRQQLLRQAGLTFQSVTSQYDETLDEKSGKSAKSIAEMLSLKKALAVSKQHPTKLVIGCDQTMEHDDKIIQRPKTKNEAHDQLLILRGNAHHLHSAVTIVHNQAVLWQHIETTTLTMRHFSNEFLHDYLESLPDQQLEECGIYKVEGQGITLFKDIRGDHNTILGLPLLPLLNFLQGNGYIIS